MPILKINRKGCKLDVLDDTQLLWTKREELRLSGTKFGCGMGLCGACTALVDGNAVRSCVTPVAAVQGAEITSIEVLSTQGNHPVQSAWMQLNVVQCRYCQSGHI